MENGDNSKLSGPFKNGGHEKMSSSEGKSGVGNIIFSLLLLSLNKSLLLDDMVRACDWSRKFSNRLCMVYQIALHNGDKNLCNIASRPENYAKFGLIDCDIFCV